MTSEELALDLEYRARCVRTIASSIHGDIIDSDATSGRDYRDNSRAASLEHTAATLRDLARLVREQRIPE